LALQQQAFGDPSLRLRMTIHVACFRAGSLQTITPFPPIVVTLNAIRPYAGVLFSNNAFSVFKGRQGLTPPVGGF
jgi:hypothetical protein